MTEATRRWRTFAAALLVMVVVIGCAGSASAPQLSESEGGGTAADRGNPGAGAPDPYPAASGAAPSGAPSEPDAVVPDTQLIVRTGNLDLQVGNVDDAVAKAHDAIVGLGGYVGASQLSSQGGHPVASVTYRIPVARWDDGLARLRGLGKVLGETTAAEEVTSQVVDLGARIDNLRASERALQAIAAKATKISEVLEVQRELTGVRGEIERLVAQKQSLEQRAALATLAVRYSVPVVAVVDASKGWDPGTEVDQASARLVSIGQAVTSAGIWFVIVWVPILLVMAVLGIVGAVVARRMGLRRRAAIPPSPPPAATGA